MGALTPSLGRRTAMPDAREAGPAGRGHTASQSGWRFSASFPAGITSRHASSTTHGGVCWMPQVRHFDDLASAEMAFAADA
jgi:hypothetical protein